MLTLNGRSWRFHGHAIVSADDRIADATGQTPASLRHEADWLRFQAALDVSVVTVVGRLGHEANPNLKGRNRLVLSSAVSGIERRADAWWWNPAEAPLAEALAAAAPQGGIVAIPGGMRVFDLFLAAGYDEFHLSRVANVLVPDGTPLFSAVRAGHTADALLAASGLHPDAPQVLDPAAHLSLTVWRGGKPAPEPA
jgi:dihydrofolate reductase